jgi:hypothetical protein
LAHGSGSLALGGRGWFQVNTQIAPPLPVRAYTGYRAERMKAVDESADADMIALAMDGFILTKP